MIFKLFNYHPTLIEFLKDIKYVLFAKGNEISGGAKKYPKVLQLPITYNCNSKCVMCNIWQMDYSNEFTHQEFSAFMKDSVFSKIEHVGINGGEPTLVKGLVDYAEQILTLPSLKTLNIITHGFNKKQLFPLLEGIYAKCKKKGIKFHLSISLDGYDEIHNTVRGLKVFKIIDQNIKKIQENMEQYCDTMNLGCTVIKQNVSHLIELDEYVKTNYNIPIKYRLGIENKRIESHLLKEQYSLLIDPSVQTAKEFFYSRFLLSKNLKDKFKYFAIFYFMNAKKRKRLLGCDWKEQGVTMDSRGELYYCAVQSDTIGSLRKTQGNQAFFDEKNIAYRKTIIENDCDNCIHDYHGKPERANVMVMIRELLREKLYWVNYRFNINLF